VPTYHNTPELRQITVRDIPQDLWRQVKAKAALNRVSVRRVIQHLLELYVKAQP
jgi:hypothetical protein